MKIIVVMMLLVFFGNSFSQKWQKLNGPEGGSIAGLIIKGDTIVTATGNSTYNGIFFYSSNRGITWVRSKTKFKNSFIDFVFANDGGIIAASYASGLFKSFDLLNWRRVFYNGQDFYSTGKDKNGVLYAGTDAGKIYSSTNNGISWNLLFNGNERIVRFLTLPSGRMFAGAINNILRKDLNEPNWTKLDLDSVQGLIRPFIDDSNNVFFFSAPWLFSSSDAGQTWGKSDIIPFLQGNDMSDCIYNNRMIAACSDETGFFGTGWGIAVSDDKGITWNWSNNGFPPKFSACVALAKSGNDTYVGTNAAGVFKSTNFGDSWFAVNNGIHAALTPDIHFDKEGNLYSASWSNGIHKSTDKGLTWKAMNDGLTNIYLYCIVSDDNGNLLAGTDQGTFRSTDKGESWSTLNSWFFAFLHKDRFNRMYGCRYGGGLYRSTDLGNSWIKLDKGFLNGYVYGFAIDRNDNLYAGTLGGAIYKSTDDGNTWFKVYQSNNGNSLVMSIAIAPNGYIYATNMLEGILRSTDEGLSWSLRKTDNNYQTRYPIAVSDKGDVYAASSNKFYLSTTNGDTWTDVTDNLIYTSVWNITFDNAGKMYLATDESVWTEAQDSTVNINEVITSPKEYSLEQNFPNPFNPVTTIKYSIPVSGQVIIKVFNTLGKEVLLLVNEIKNAGSYEVSFDGSILPSGVYFYRIHTGLFIQTKKMILLK